MIRSVKRSKLARRRWRREGEVKEGDAGRRYVSVNDGARRARRGKAGQGSGRRRRTGVVRRVNWVKCREVVTSTDGRLQQVDPSD